MTKGSGSVFMLMDLTAAAIDVVNCNVIGNATINLGDVNVLSVQGDGQALITYQGDPIKELRLKHDAKVERVNALLGAD